MKKYSIDRFLKNIVWQEGTGKNLTPLLYSDEKKWKFFEQKNIIWTKRIQAFEGFSGTYNVVILSSFSPGLQLIDTEFAIKDKLRKYCLH